MLDIFDMLGPVMVGPSSSHTAGAVRIGRMARSLLGQEPVRAELFLHGSFASTGEGHGTHQALIAGLLGLSPDDDRVPGSFALAEERGLSFTFSTRDLRDVHPNSVLIRLEGDQGGQLEVGASSPGGGRILVFQVDGLDTSFTGALPTLVVHNSDQPGCVSQVTGALAQQTAREVAQLRAAVRQAGRKRSLSHCPVWIRRCPCWPGWRCSCWGP